MSSSRRTLDSSATRRANRSQAASPYSRGAATRKAPKASNEASAAAGEIKTSSSLASLLSLLNPFRRRTEPPKSLPQIIQQQEQDRSPSTPIETSSDDDYRERSDNDSRIVEDQLAGIASAASSLMRSGKNFLPVQIPFPTVGSPHSQGTLTPPRASLFPSNPSSRPITPGSTRDPDRTRRSLAPVPPTPATGLGQSNGFKGRALLKTPGALPSSRSALTLSQLGPTGTTLENPEGSPLKTLQDFIESRPKAGPLTSAELQKVEGIMQATVINNGSHLDDDYGKPSAAFLGRGFVPGPSKSFLAPQASTSTLPQSEFKFHVPTSTSFHTALSSGSSWTAPTTTRKRPIYIGPGMSTQTRPHRSSMLMKSATHGSLSSLNGTGRSGLRSNRPAAETSRNLLPIEESSSVPEGKRRRLDDNGSSENGPSRSTLLGPAIDAKPASPVPSATSNVISPPKSTNQVPRSVPLRTAVTQLSSTNPAHPSPLRNMTKPNDSPSPPTIPRSRTSGAVMDILREADKLNPPRGTANKSEEFANPYENKSRPVPVQIKSKRPTPKSKESAPGDRPGNSSSSKGKKPAQPAKGAPSAASGSSRSSFMAPVRTGRPTRDAPAQKEVYTVDDVEMDDDVEEISEIPPPSKSATKREVGQQNGTSKFGRGRRASQNLPPITVEEVVDDDDDSTSTNKMNGVSTNGIGRRGGIKPSLVIEPEEPRRYGRSPSLGPRFHSPTIPSPLRVVSMPGEDDSSSSSGMENGTPALKAMDVAVDTDVDMGVRSIEQVINRGIDKVKTRREAPMTPQDEAKALLSSSLPKFSFDIPTPTVTAFAAVIVGEQREAKGTEIAKLPKFTFDLIALATSTSTSSRVEVNIAGSSSGILPQPEMKVQAFDFKAAGLARPKESEGSSWDCPICMLSNPSTATEKCSICESPRPNSSKSAPSTITANGISSDAPAIPPLPAAFNWAAAGLAPKSAPSGVWTCGLCGLSNGEADSKCTVCDSPR